MNRILRGVTLAFNPAGARRRRREPDAWAMVMSDLARGVKETEARTRRGFMLTAEARAAEARGTTVD